MRALHDLVVTVQAPACALADAGGQIRAAGMHGLFVADIRVLSQARLCVNGEEPVALLGLPEGPGRTRFVGAATGLGDGGPDPTVRLDRVRIVRPDGMQELIRIRSSAAHPVAAMVTVDLRCDLTTLEGAKAAQSRPELAAALVTAAGDRPCLQFVREHERVTVAAPEAELSTDPPRLAWAVDVPAGGERQLRWSLTFSERRPFVVAPTGPVEWSRPEVSADEPRLARLLGQALDDVAALRLAEVGDPTLAFVGAGAPWFLTLFGRDSLWAARMLLPLGTELAASTLRVLARRQGTRVNLASGEAPGKIMHELRREDVRLGATTTHPATYFGTVDASLLWISLLTDAWRWGMPDATVAALLPNLRRALSWMEHHGDPDGDGFIEYVDPTGRGLANQGWKDSGGAIRFHDGGLAQPSVALCEVQGYAHRAALDAATLLVAFDGRTGEADRWRDYAAKLSARFRDRFWVSGELGPFPALALDGRGRPVDSLTSNIGHLLGTGLLNREEEATVARLLGADALSSGFGLRTMSTLDAAFSPLSYHCGSIWPHDTAIVLRGLAVAGAVGVPGADVAATRLVIGLLDAAEGFDYRLPELYGGDPRGEAGRPVPHPAACRPQGWAAAAAVAVLQAVLGLSVDVREGRVGVRPLSGLGALDVRGLRVAGRSVDVRVERSGATEVRGLPEIQRP
jgi:glycogen debranching enzyme